MPQNFASDDDEFESLPDPEVARIVLELDRKITLNRRAAALRYIVHGNPLPLPVKPSRGELLVLAALVQTYGSLLLATTSRRCANASWNAVPWSCCSRSYLPTQPAWAPRTARMGRSPHCCRTRGRSSRRCAASQKS